MNIPTPASLRAISPRRESTTRRAGLVAACLAASAFAAAPAAASHARNGLNDARAIKALELRSAALNHRYHLDRAVLRWTDSLCPCNAGLPHRRIESRPAAVGCPSAAEARFARMHR